MSNSLFASEKVIVGALGQASARSKSPQQGVQGGDAHIGFVFSILGHLCLYSLKGVKGVNALQFTQNILCDLRPGFQRVFQDHVSTSQQLTPVYEANS